MISPLREGCGRWWEVRDAGKKGEMSVMMVKRVVYRGESGSRDPGHGREGGGGCDVRGVGVGSG